MGISKQIVCEQILILFEIFEAVFSTVQIQKKNNKFEFMSRRFFVVISFQRNVSMTPFEQNKRLSLQRIQHLFLSSRNYEHFKSVIQKMVYPNVNNNMIFAFESGLEPERILKA